MHSFKCFYKNRKYLNAILYASHCSNSQSQAKAISKCLAQVCREFLWVFSSLEEIRKVVLMMMLIYTVIFLLDVM